MDFFVDWRGHVTPNLQVAERDCVSCLRSRCRRQGRGLIVAGTTFVEHTDSVSDYERSWYHACAVGPHAAEWRPASTSTRTAPRTRVISMSLQSVIIWVEILLSWSNGVWDYQLFAKRPASSSLFWITRAQANPTLVVERSCEPARNRNNGKCCLGLLHSIVC